MQSEYRFTARTQGLSICGLSVFAIILYLLIVNTVRNEHVFSLQEGTPIRYDNETISWHACPDSGEGFECSTIVVPMDQFNSTVSLDKNFSIPLMRFRGRDGSPNLLLNPGGPGVSGLEDLRERAAELRQIVGDSLHLLSFDPRGIGGSRPLATCYPTEESSHKSPRPRSHDVIHDSPELYAWTQNYVRACRDSTAGFGRYVNTPQTAADMNSILDAIGQSHLFYWGFSYGTALGQTYATLFPSRVHRLIIDGVVDLHDWYESRFDFAGLEDAERALQGFFDECAAAGSACRLASPAASGRDLARHVKHLLQDLQAQPRAVYLNATTYGLLTYEHLLYDGIFPALYNPSSWPRLAECLAGLLAGNATEAFLSYGAGIEWISNHFLTMNDGVSGPAHWPQDRSSMLEALIPRVRESLFGPAAIAAHYVKQQWAIPKSHTFRPQRRVETAHPLLILSTSVDPVCPLRAAVAARERFVGAQVVEVSAVGHCSYAMPSECLARRVREYLYRGMVPGEQVVCGIDGAYFGREGERRGNGWRGEGNDGSMVVQN